MTVVDGAFPRAPAAEDSDQVTIAAIIAGDAEGIASTRRWIRAAAGRYRRFLASDLEDLEQEVLIALIAALKEDRFRHDCRLETYVSRMVHYRCIDRLRAASRRKWIDIGDLDLPSDETTALQKLQQDQGSQLALRVAASQSVECRKLWDMLHDGLSYSEMATKIGVAAGTLRVRVLRCRRKAIEVRDQIQQQESMNGGNG